jgi:hypothetical protein
VLIQCGAELISVFPCQLVVVFAVHPEIFPKGILDAAECLFQVLYFSLSKRSAVVCFAEKNNQQKQAGKGQQNGLDHDHVQGLKNKDKWVEPILLEEWKYASSPPAPGCRKQDAFVCHCPGFITLRSRVQIPVSLHENQGLRLNRGPFVVSA